MAEVTLAASDQCEANIPRLPVNSETHKFHNWTVNYTKSHILHSKCTNECKDNLCQFCMYSKTLPIPHLPEMVFPNNILTLAHPSGIHIEFNAYDALNLISNENIIKVWCSKAWKESRDPANLEEVKAFDWTFSTNYKGSLNGPVVITPTDERINMERLKVKEQILFYQELMLFEDELHDNGIATCTVKIRVMPSSFFVLLRYFLRVDGVMVRLNDTRFFHDFSTNYVLREFTNKECDVNSIRLPLPAFGDPNQISSHIPLVISSFEKLMWNEDAVVAE